jgi:hypothetical protein
MRTCECGIVAVCTNLGPKPNVEQPHGKSSRSLAGLGFTVLREKPMKSVQDLGLRYKANLKRVGFMSSTPLADNQAFVSRSRRGLHSWLSRPAGMFQWQPQWGQNSSTLRRLASRFTSAIKGSLP